METQQLVGIIVPLVLALIMFGLGLSLSIEDFKRIKESPRTIFTALFIQLAIIPAYAFLLCWAFALPANLALGLVLLSSTPGGPTSNIFSYLARGNVALNVTLTAINSLIAIVFVPAMVFLGAQVFFSEGLNIPLQTSKLVQVILIMIIPMALGVWIARRRPAFAAACEKHVSRLAIIVLLLIIIFGVRQESDLIQRGIMTAGFAIILFNVGTIIMALLGCRWMKLKHEDSVAITFELGIHNCTLALAIAISPQLLNNMETAIPAALYVVIMYFTATPLAFWLCRRGQLLQKRSL